MYSQKSNFCLFTLSNILQKDIDYFTTCIFSSYKQQKIKNKKAEIKKNPSDNVQEKNEETPSQNNSEIQSKQDQPLEKNRFYKVDIADGLLIISENSIFIILDSEINDIQVNHLSILNNKKKDKGFQKEIKISDITHMKVKFRNEKRDNKPTLRITTNVESKSDEIIERKFTFKIDNMKEFIEVLNGLTKLYKIMDLIESTEQKEPSKNEKKDQTGTTVGEKTKDTQDENASKLQDINKQIIKTNDLYENKDFMQVILSNVEENKENEDSTVKNENKSQIKTSIWKNIKLNISKSKLENSSKIAEENRLPNSEDWILIDGYKFFIPSSYCQNKNDSKIFEYVQEDQEILSKLIINVSDELPIQYFSENPKNRSFSFAVLNSLSKYISFILTSLNLKYYIKELDSSKYENYSTVMGKNVKKERKSMKEEFFEAFVQTAIDEVEEPNYTKYKNNTIKRVKGFEIRTEAVKNTGKCFIIYFFYIRHMFIQPFYESFRDITIMQINELNVDNGKKSVETKDKEENKLFSVIEDIVMKLQPYSKKMYNNACKNFIKLKLESFLLDSKTFHFVYNVLDLGPNEIIKFAKSFKGRLLLFYNENDLVDPKLENMYKLFGLNGSKDDSNNLQILELKKYFSDLMNKSFKELIDNIVNNLYINYYKEDKEVNLKDSHTFTLIYNKIINYLFYTLNDNSFLPLRNKKRKILTLEDMIVLSEKSEKFRKELYPVLNYLLNFLIITKDTHDIILETSIENILKNIGNIQFLSFNEDLLCITIKKNILMKIQNLNNNVLFFQFLKFILTNNFTYKIFKAFTIYLEDFTKNMEKKNQTVSIIVSKKKICDLLVPTILSLYSERNNNAKIIEYSTRCLICFMRLNKNMKHFLSNNADFNNNLYYYLSSPYPDLLKYSVEMFINLPTNNTDLVRIFTKNDEFFNKIIGILTGKKIQNCYDDPELLLKIMIFLKKKIKDRNDYSFKIFIKTIKPKTFLQSMKIFLGNSNSVVDEKLLTKKRLENDSSNQQSEVESDFIYYQIYAYAFKALTSIIDEDYFITVYLDKSKEGVNSITNIIRKNLESNLKNLEIILDENKDNWEDFRNTMIFYKKYYEALMKFISVLSENCELIENKFDKKHQDDDDKKKSLADLIEYAKNKYDLAVKYSNKKDNLITELISITNKNKNRVSDNSNSQEKKKLSNPFKNDVRNDGKKDYREYEEEMEKKVNDE